MKQSLKYLNSIYFWSYSPGVVVESGTYLYSFVVGSPEAVSRDRLLTQAVEKKTEKLCTLVTPVLKAIWAPIM